MAKRRIHSIGDYRQEEANAGEAGIYPGMLVKLNSSGNVIKHDVQGGFAEAAFAVEDALQGKTVSDVYANGSKVTYILPAKGSVVNALINAGENIAIGDKLISNGDGTLVEIGAADSAGTTTEIIAIAVEACDLSASGAVDTLAAVRIV